MKEDEDGNYDMTGCMWLIVIGIIVLIFMVLVGAGATLP